MQFNVVGVRLALIPYYPLNSIAFQWQHARFKHVARLIGVALVCGFLSKSNVFECAFACPWLPKIAMIPVIQDRWELPFQGVAVNPRLCCGATNGITNDTHRHFEAIGQSFSKMIGHSRERSYRCFIGYLPPLRV